MGLFDSDSDSDGAYQRRVSRDKKEKTKGAAVFDDGPAEQPGQRPPIAIGEHHDDSAEERPPFRSASASSSATPKSPNKKSVGLFGESDDDNSFLCPPGSEAPVGASARAEDLAIARFATITTTATAEPKQRTENHDEENQHLSLQDVLDDAARQAKAPLSAEENAREAAGALLQSATSSENEQQQQQQPTTVGRLAKASLDEPPPAARWDPLSGQNDSDDEPKDDKLRTPTPLARSSSSSAAQNSTVVAGVPLDDDNDNERPAVPLDDEDKPADDGVVRSGGRTSLNGISVTDARRTTFNEKSSLLGARGEDEDPEERNLLTDILVGYDDDGERHQAFDSDTLHYRLASIDILRGFAVVCSLMLLPQNMFKDSATTTAQFFQFSSLYPSHPSYWAGIFWSDIFIMPVFAFVMGICLALSAEAFRCDQRGRDRLTSAARGLGFYNWCCSPWTLGCGVSGNIRFRNDLGALVPNPNDVEFDRLSDSFPGLTFSGMFLNILRVLTRGFLLLCFGLIVNFIASGFDTEDMLYTGPFQRLAVSSTVAALVYRLRFVNSEPWLGAILRPLFAVIAAVVYIAVVYALYVPDCGSGRVESAECNAVSYADSELMGANHVRQPSDPFGYFAILTEIVIVMVGAEFGCGLHRVHCPGCATRDFHWSRKRLAFQWFGISLVLFAAGIAVSEYIFNWIPISANISSISFVAVASGFVGVSQAVLYFLVDVSHPFIASKCRAVLIVLRWAGANALLLALGPQVLLALFDGIQIKTEDVSLWRWIYNHGFLTWISSEHVASATLAVCWTTLWLLFAWRTFRKRLFWRL